MNNINIYEDYKIKVWTKYNYISQEDSTPNDIVFSEADDYTEEVVNGGMLLEIVRLKLSDSDISSFSFIRNEIIIENFDPTSGECSTTVIKLRRKRRDK